jgi:hypothetical protein
MAEIELFDENSDINNSKIVINLYRIANGWLPSWHFEVREEADMAELIALGDGIKLAQTQFDKLMDMVLAED